MLSTSTSYLTTESESIKWKKNAKEALKTQSEIEVEKKKYFKADKR